MGKFLDAAETVLRRHGQAMKVGEITEEALTTALLENCAGLTPNQTMKAKLSVDIKRNGARSRFKRVAPALFTLRESVEKEYVAKPFEKTMSRTEDVVVFPTRLLKRIGWFHGIRRDTRRYLTLLEPSNTTVMPRIDAETNLAFKQIISYVIIRYHGMILRYIRGSYSSVNSFLKGRVCIGFGGHVQGADHTLFDVDDSGYLTSVIRELTEELAIPMSYIDEDSLQLVGVLNDDSSLLGNLHFAFIHILDLDGLPRTSARVLKREKSINKLQFVPVRNLGDEYERYEYWSKLCIQEFFKGTVGVRCRVHPVRNFKLANHSKLIVVVGTIGSGKTEVARILHQDFGYELISTGDVIQELLGVSMKKVGRGRVQNLANAFIKSPTGPETLATAITQRIQPNPDKRYVIDGLRNLPTHDALSRKLSREIALIYVDSTVDNAYEFYRTRENQKIRFEEFIDIFQHEVEAEIPRFLPMSNVVIYNHGTKRSYQDTVKRYFNEELASV